MDQATSDFGTVQTGHVKLPAGLAAVAFFVECIAGVATDRRSGVDRRQRREPLVFADGDQRSGKDRRRAEP